MSAPRCSHPRTGEPEEWQAADITRGGSLRALVTLHTVLLKETWGPCGPRRAGWGEGYFLGQGRAGRKAGQATVGQGPAELQEAAEGQGGHVGLPPALCLLLHILFELDPACRLPPLRLLVFVQQQLIQFHKHLV